MRMSATSILRIEPRHTRLLVAVTAVIAVLPAQSPDTLDWQTVAGGRQTFEVASVKWHVPNFPLNTGDAKPAGGRFSATFPVLAYIIFAYKVPPYQSGAMIAQLPKCCRGLRFLRRCASNWD
jgi:hypothetical protein